MVCKKIRLFTCVLVGIFSPICGVHALDSTQIEAVRSRTLQSKSALSTADEAVVDKFVRDGLTELRFEEDAWRAVDAREALLAQKGGAELSPYAAAFAATVAEHLKVAFEDAARLQQPRRQRMTLSLMIIAARLQTPELVPFGLAKLADPDPTIQYWGVKTVTNPGVAAQLTSQIVGDEELTRSIVNRLDQVVGETMVPETMRMVVEFADRVGTAEGRALVNKIADLRLRQYANWTVKYELLEMPILTSLGKQIVAEASDTRRADLLRRFAQLYSYVIERFVLSPDMLNELQKQQLVSVIAEIENGAVTELFGRPQNRIRKALEGNKPSVLEAERQILLGGPTQAGQLAGKFTYDYGRAGGSVITEPLRLTAPVSANGQSSEQP